MNGIVKDFLAAKIIPMLLVVCLTIPLTKQSNAGIPVIDVAGLVQSVVSAVENVTQTLQMIESYKTQLTQYENQLINTINPDIWIWDQAQKTMNELRNAVNTIKTYKNTQGSLENYLKKYRDLKFYKNHPCLTSAGCTASQRQTLLSIRSFASEATKKANDALIKGLDIQQDAMVSDARQLERIQAAAQTATGQVQAVQYANQLAGNQVNQLLQIRSLLVAQQSATSAIHQAQNDIRAQEAASTQKLRDSVYEPSTQKKW